MNDVEGFGTFRHHCSTEAYTPSVLTVAAKLREMSACQQIESARTFRISLRSVRALFVFFCGIHLGLTVIPSQEILKQFLTSAPGTGSMLQCIKGAQIVIFALKHDLGNPLSLALIEIDTTDTAGVGLGKVFGTDQLYAGSFHKTHCGSGIMAAAAPGAAAILQIGLADRHLVAAVTAASPQMAAFFPARVRYYYQLSEPPHYPVLQGRLPSTATAAGTAGEKLGPGSFYLGAAVALAPPEGISALGASFRLLQYRQLPEPQSC